MVTARPRYQTHLFRAFGARHRYHGHRRRVRHQLCVSTAAGTPTAIREVRCMGIGGACGTSCVSARLLAPATVRADGATREHPPGACPCGREFVEMYDIAHVQTRAGEFVLICACDPVIDTAAVVVCGALPPSGDEFEAWDATGVSCALQACYLPRQPRSKPS